MKKYKKKLLLIFLYVVLMVSFVRWLEPTEAPIETPKHNNENNYIRNHRAYYCLEF